MPFVFLNLVFLCIFVFLHTSSHSIPSPLCPASRAFSTVLERLNHLPACEFIPIDESNRDSISSSASKAGPSSVGAADCARWAASSAGAAWPAARRMRAIAVQAGLAVSGRVTASARACSTRR